VIDPIRFPAHYIYSEFEPRDVIPSWTGNSSQAFLIGAALKYLCRSGAPTGSRKAPEIEDWRKAREMLDVAISRAERPRPPHSKDCTGDKYNGEQPTAP
jgi:hypothetical protein